VSHVVPQWYRQRPVTVIGGLGFLGINLTMHLAGLGARVTVVTRSLDRHRAEASDCEARGVAVREGDLRDHDAMRATVAGRTSSSTLQASPAPSRA